MLQLHVREIDRASRTSTTEARANRSSKSPSHDWAYITGLDRLAGRTLLRPSGGRVIERFEVSVERHWDGGATPAEALHQRFLRALVERIQEDEYTVAFMDINPIAPGHTLVVPKAHFVGLLDLEDDTARLDIPADVPEAVSERVRMDFPPGIPIPGTRTSGHDDPAMPRSARRVTGQPGVSRRRGIVPGKRDTGESS